MSIFGRILGHRQHENDPPDQDSVRKVLEDPDARRMAGELYRHLNPGERQELESMVRMGDMQKIREFILSRHLDWEEILKHKGEH